MKHLLVCQVFPSARHRTLGVPWSTSERLDVHFQLKERTMLDQRDIRGGPHLGWHARPLKVLARQMQVYAA